MFRIIPVIIMSSLLLLAGCAATGKAILAPEVPAMHTIQEFGDDERIIDIADPWENFNRSMYKFNYYFDRYLFLPVVNAYEFITPSVVQDRITNFFSNIGELKTLYNSLLQLNGEKFFLTFNRFLTNSTVGIGGLFDPASSLGMEKKSEDFGRTLGYWGVGSGPYLVLPVLGPNTLRSAGGSAVDTSIRYALLNAADPLENIDNGNSIVTGISILESIDLRHREKFRYYESGYPFEYDLLRFSIRKKKK